MPLVGEFVQDQGPIDEFATALGICSVVAIDGLEMMSEGKVESYD